MVQKRLTDEQKIIKRGFASLWRGRWILQSKRRRERRYENSAKIAVFSLPQSRFTRQLPRQREPRNLTDQFTGASNSCMAGRPTKKRTCAPPVSVRAMPENEKPPAMRVDIYCIYWTKNKYNEKYAQNEYKSVKGIKSQKYGIKWGLIVKNSKKYWKNRKNLLIFRENCIYLSYCI